MKDEKEILVDDSAKEEKIETPIVETIEQPKKKTNSELIVAIVLIVVIIGVFIAINYFKKKNAEQNG